MLYIKQMNNKDLLYSTGNYIQYLVIKYNRKEYIIQEWVAIYFSRRSSQPRDQTWVSRTVGRRFTIWATRETPYKYIHIYVFSLYINIWITELLCCIPETKTTFVNQSCLTLWDPLDCSTPGSSVHEVLQARILEWVAMPSSKGSSQCRGQTHVSHVSCTGRRVLYHSYHLESPNQA